MRALKLGLPYMADSAALALELGQLNQGPISWHTRNGLVARGVNLGLSVRRPRAVSIEDFQSAFMIIAMSRREHLPMVKESHGDWLEITQFWEVADVDELEPKEALEQIEQLVEALIKSLHKQMS